jgi:succinyl-CoA synthetase beta subunit
MNLHEYQAKQILSEYDLPVPKGIVVRSLDEVIAAAELFQTDKIVVKAQVHAGGRGKAGGVKLVKNREELISAAQSMLHKNLVTYQTNAAGQPVNALLLEETCDIAKELYLGAVIDRSQRRVVIMASTEGGVDIEEVATDNPEKILKEAIDPLLGVMPYQCRELAYGLRLTDKQVSQFSNIAMNLGKLFVAKDLSLIEINPLVITKGGDLICLDAKINIDDNALYRQPELRAMWDPTQEDAREIKAREWGLSYISLDGNIGCMVNGAGLAMATMDLIKLCGGAPANFLDVGGGATQERVTEAFKIILSDLKVKAVLVNIFGGIVRCDLIAAGIIAAVTEVGIKVPVVVRLEGNQAAEGGELLSQSGLNIIAAQSWLDAAEQVVQVVGDAE